MPSTPGNYYLTTNVTLSATWSISESIHLDLNGYSVTLQNEEGGSVINISSGTLTLCDSVGTGVITGGNATNGGGVLLAADATLEMYGGTITGNTASKEGSKCNKNQRYQEYKIGAKRIVRLRIKRGILHCEFLMINRDLRNYVSENKIPVKETATVIKVQNTETVQMVFSSIDLAIQLIEEERAYKKQLAKERRRQAKQQAKQ